MNKTFIGTVGYHNLANHSIASALLPRLQEEISSPSIVVDELNWGPIAIVQKFQALHEQYDRVILMAAVERPGRFIGEVTWYRWMGKLPDNEMIQRCIGDAVTGVISVENLLVIGQYFNIWPSQMFVMDIEPGPEQAGEHFTEEMNFAIPNIIHSLKQLAQQENVELIKFIPLYGDTMIETDVRE